MANFDTSTSTWLKADTRRVEALRRAEHLYGPDIELAKVRGSEAQAQGIDTSGDDAVVVTFKSDQFPVAVIFADGEIVEVEGV